MTVITGKLKFLSGSEVGVAYFLQFQPVVTESHDIVNELSLVH